MRRSIVLFRSLPQAEKGRESAYKLVVSNALKTPSIQMPVIILVNPYSEENIGSISRTMLNFGLSELRIVSPKCDILSPKARVLAVGSVELLENAKIYDTIEDSVSDLHRIIATSGKSRSTNLDIHTPSSAAKISVTNNKIIGK
jgi:tRNA C32,U32 (ribose-2'-O)-methylase TrmJ